MTQTATDIDARPLPAGWKWVKLGDVAQYFNGRVFHSSEWSTVGLPIIRIQNLNNTNAEFNYFDGTVSAQNYVEAGDLLVSWSASLDVYFWDRLPGALNQHIFKVQENPSVVDKDFLFFSLKYVMTALRAMTHGGTMTHVTRKVFESTAIPLPPMEEQKRIAAILNEQMAAVDKAKKAAEERLEAAKALPAAYLREVFQDEQDDWALVTLGDLLSPRSEVIHPRNNPKGEAYFVGLQHIESNTGTRVGLDNIEKSEMTGRKPAFYEGDIVYGYLRPYLNKVWLAEFEGLCSVDQYVYQVNPSKSIPEYIRYFMLSDVYLRRAPISESPGQLPRIRTEEVAAVEVKFPPLEQQQITAKELDSKLANLKLSEESIQQELEAIKAMPAALLRKAFAGEL